ncbi:GH35 family beta-galactosidase [Sphingomonas sp. CLY1604]|uniref:GH35 family beta-galactosidase n=1 Tax=Sphingomonas sp. CLY1604 TaxID=3457786 RepID=UPI003FD86DB0
MASGHIRILDQIALGADLGGNMTARAQSYAWRLFATISMLSSLAGGMACAQTRPSNLPVPRLRAENGRHSLIVDGEPFLMLGAQIQNSSNYVSVLPKVWPTIADMNANTVEVPVAWEQLEPREGQFDYSFVDALITQARARKLRVVLLWFGTWKNAAPTYAPEWVKTDVQRFPRMRKSDGSAEQSFSPHGRQTLTADKRAFVKLMEHLREVDGDHTVLMIQPENEVGSLGTSRDFSPAAQLLFDGQVPAALISSLKRSPGTWKEVFGTSADQFFNAWYIASYINEVASAGKAVLNLPMYCNAALTDPFDPSKAGGGAVGGPNWNVIDVWKAAAPSIDFVAPDIYIRRQQAVAAILDRYARPDNALMVPEIGNAAEFARFFWLALGRGAIGFSPFGMDGTGFSNYPLGAQIVDEATFAKFAEPYGLFAPMARDWASIAQKHATWGFAKGDDAADQSKVMGTWTVTAEYGLWESKERTDPRMVPHPNLNQPVGGAVVAQLGPDEFLVAGTDVRIRFKQADNPATEYLSVEEGSYVKGVWTMSRRWNGDQTDFGLNFVRPVMLRVRLHSFR